MVVSVRPGKGGSFNTIREDLGICHNACGRTLPEIEIEIYTGIYAIYMYNYKCIPAVGTRASGYPAG